MNYFELQKQLIEEANHHKILVEREVDTNLNIAMQDKNFKKLFVEIKDQKRELAKLQNNTKESRELEKSILATRKKMIGLLKEKNIELQAIIPKYWCRRCKDTGIVGSDVCNCISTRITNFLRKEDSSSLNLPTFKNADLKIFDNPEYMSKVFDTAKQFIEKMDSTKYNNFTIIGWVGAGKTYLMKCMANHALDLGKSVIEMTSFRLNQLFLDYYTCSIRDKNSVIDPILNCDLLCIDDLGCEQLLNNVTVPTLTMVINERNALNKKTIITSNLSLDEIRERYDYRLGSRLIDKNSSITINVENKDLRQK